jgi:hypothetical protein
MMPVSVGSREGPAGAATRSPGTNRQEKCDTGKADNVEAAMSAGDADFGVYPEGEDQVPIEELARRQGVRPIKSAAELVHPEVWESDEELQAFLADLYASRSAGSSAP